VYQNTNGDHVSGQKHVVILCHPDPHSFNAKVAQTYCDAVHARSHDAIVRDLYGMNFNPVLQATERPSSHKFVPMDDVVTELDALGGADVIVFVYPIWFGTPPAMMKGYVERVLGAGFGHRLMSEPGRGSIAAGKHLVSITTSGNSSQWLEAQGTLVSLRNVFDQYLANAFSMESHEHLHLSEIVENLSDNAIRRELRRVTDFADTTCARRLPLTAFPQATAL
jgi:NAD(P)H dehydrogenase (quinone)